ncbi:MAG: adenylate/guanylate cyclase domain-containing protein [Alphaproteobacteria bacterium]
MATRDSAALTEWITREGLRGADAADLLQGFCERLVAAGVPLLRSHVAQSARHPVLGGIGFNWHRDGTKTPREGYDHTPTPREQWRSSPFYFMMREGQPVLRRDLRQPRASGEFPLLAELAAAGGTDYYAVTVSFDRDDVTMPVDPNNPPAGLIASWTTDAADGFSDDQIALIDELLPALGLALKSASADRLAHDLLEAYLGRDAGRRVLSGDLRRGSLDAIRAVIWCFDLHGFTKLAETTPAPLLIDMLNDYFDVVVTTVESHGGDVLKFMGDGLLAIFRFDDNDDACCDALTAADELRGTLAEVNRRRAAADLPRAGSAMALHLGEVMYGNIGARHRLDFTVIGPAVNMASRVLDLCRPLEHDLLISGPLAAAAKRDRARIVSIGRYVLRGVAAPQELYTLVGPQYAVGAAQ